MTVKVIVVLGNKSVGGKLHPEFAHRCEVAAILARRHKDCGTSSVIVLAGGETVRGCGSEASTALPYLRERLAVMDVHVPILLEEASRTTPENVRFAKECWEHEGVVPHDVTIVGRASQIPKTRVLVHKLWGADNICVQFFGSKDMNPFWVRWIDRTLMVLVSWLDPKDKFFLSGFKKVFRNA